MASGHEVDARSDDRSLFVLWIGSIDGAPLHAVARDHLMLTKDGVLGGSVWSLLTYAFFENGFFGVLFAAIAVWLFGSELQQRWSPAKFWLTQLGAIVVGGLLSFALLAAVDSPLTVRGYHGAAMALVFSYCWAHWNEPLYFFFFAMRGRTMLLFFLGLGVITALLSGYWPSLVLDVSGIAVGFFASLGGFNMRDLRTRIRLWQARKRLKVVPPPEESGRGKAQELRRHVDQLT